ncbi:hypothetical protein DLM45_03275 [Hyphomicrobium methylovorum]|uniref:hypothetical protein n=1 Tax=Hyphomicrobium methylovorum TaxID=84 RepID=UPI0015E643D0|nr:hypothetical protein [Hyphomicrobium methylovorum]MBA2125245.1 hypothetical protein [Hyphomicrobium methylovorum]
MAMMRVALVLCLGAIYATAAAADEEKSPAHYACDFKAGFSWSYEGGKFASSPPSELKFEIGNVDLEKQSATLVLDGKSANTLKIVRALNANHFLEVVNEGFLNLTTIYDRDPATGEFPAVHSRHFGLFGQPMFAQYAGTCTEKP